jgi:predicted permease
MLVNALQDDVTRMVRPALLAVLGAVMLVLIIACVNVTNLLLARGAQRRGEFAMRAALGAARTRLARQLLTESLLVAVLGGALGMIVAKFGVQALVALSPSELPRVNVIRLDGAVFVFGLVITTVIGILVGLIPALQASTRDLHSGIQQRSTRAAGSRQRTRRTLVVAEVALALVLLVSAGLLLRTLHHLFAVDPGFDASHLLTMQVQEAGKKFRSDAVRFQFFERALEAVRQVPGVVSAGFTAQLPLSGDYDVFGIEFEKDRNPLGGPGFRYAVTPGYLETMRIGLRRGRLLNDHDTVNAPAVVLINESFAKRKFGGDDPIGQRIRVGPNMGQVDKPWATIVGVVDDVRQESLAVDAEDAFYLPTVQWAWGDDVLSLVVRTEGDAAAMAPAIRKAIWSVDKDQPIVRVATMEAMVARSEAQRHFALVLFECFAVVALLLAAIGIFGVLSGSVTERMREIGVRCALGASRGDILSMVLGQGITLTGIGVVIGLAGALAASQLIASMLFGVSRLDPVTYAGVILLLAGVSVVACWVPAWRAARVDPMITLRTE